MSKQEKIFYSSTEHKETKHVNIPSQVHLLSSFLVCQKLLKKIFCVAKSGRSAVVQCCPNCMLAFWELHYPKGEMAGTGPRMVLSKFKFRQISPPAHDIRTSPCFYHPNISPPPPSPIFTMS